MTREESIIKAIERIMELCPACAKKDTLKNTLDYLNKVLSELLDEQDERSCEWLKDNLGYYDRSEIHIGKSYEGCIIEDYKRAMKK